MVNVAIKKRKQMEYIVKNIYEFEIYSLSDDFVEDFCNYFNLKLKYSGAIFTNSTFAKRLKDLERLGFLYHAFTTKMDRGDGGQGGNMKVYMFTEKGWELRDSLSDKEI